MGVVALTRSFPALRVRPLERISDERLAELVHAGDDEAFAVLYARYRGPLARYCHSIVRSAEDASDAQQNAMIATLRALRTRRLEGRVRPWLYRVAHNESITVLRRRRDHVELEDGVPAPSRHENELERWELLLADLRSLPERQRGALMMREVGGLEYHEIARALMMKPSSARKAVFEARVALSEAAAGRDARCEDIRRRISEFDGRVVRGRRVRSHLDNCSACAAFALSVRDRKRVLALIPVPPAGLIGVLGGGAGVAGLGGAGAGSAGGVAGVKGGSGLSGVAVGGGSAGSALAVKGVVTCAVCMIAGAGVVIGAGGHRHHGSGARSLASVGRGARHAGAARHGAAASVESANAAGAGAPAGGAASRRTGRLASTASRSVPMPALVRVSGRPPGIASSRVQAPAVQPHHSGPPRLATHRQVPAPAGEASSSTTTTGSPSSGAVPVATTAPAPTATPTSSTGTGTVQSATSTPTSLAELAMRFASAGISLAQQATAQAVSAAQQASGADGGADGSAPTTGTGIEGFIGHFLPGHG